MPVITRIVSIGLRTGEFAFAAVVAGLIGKYLHDYDRAHSGMPHARYIYTEVIAAISVLLALLWLLPFSGGFIHWPADLVISAAWFASFGLLVNAIHGSNCGRVFNWSGITHGGYCNRLRASEAFAFLSAILWFASTLLGLWFVHKTRRDARVAHNSSHTRRRWYRRSNV